MDFVTQTFQDLQLPGLLTKEQMQKELDSGKLPKLPPAKKWVVGWVARNSTCQILGLYGWNGEKLHAGTPMCGGYTYLEDVLFEKPRGPRRSV